MGIESSIQARWKVLGLATTDVKFGTNGCWAGTWTGAGVTSTLAWSHVLRPKKLYHTRSVAVTSAPVRFPIQRPLVPSFTSARSDTFHIIFVHALNSCKVSTVTSQGLWFYEIELIYYFANFSPSFHLTAICWNWNLPIGTWNMIFKWNNVAMS